jgi:hypothetical protein
MSTTMDHIVAAPVLGGRSNQFPPLDPDTLVALRTSIQRYGVLVPIVVDRDGNILDGHHRHAIYRDSWHPIDPSDPDSDWESDLDVSGYYLPYVVVSDGHHGMPADLQGGVISKWRREHPPVEAVVGETLRAGGPCADYRKLGSTVVVPSDDPDDIARTLNLDRRHLTVEQRREFVAELRAEGQSIRAIAAATGVSPTQAGRDIKQVSPTEHVGPTSVTGTDGKSYPAKAKPTKAQSRKKFHETARQLREAFDAENPKRIAERETEAFQETCSTFIEKYGWNEFLAIGRELSKTYADKTTLS